MRVYKSDQRTGKIYQMNSNLSASVIFKGDTKPKFNIQTNTRYQENEEVIVIGLSTGKPKVIGKSRKKGTS